MSAVASKIWNAVVRAQVGKSAEDYESTISNRETCQRTISDYNALFKEDDASAGHNAEKIKERQSAYAPMVNAYYDLVTDFYEYGWGQCFHFAPRFRGETFDASIARHEHYLALRLGLKSGMKVLDIGSGVGGPMRCIARFSGSNVIGVNNNAYQCKRSDILNARYGLSHLCSNVKTDFMNLPFAPNSVDAAYAIEATCHAPDKVGCFSQIFKSLKPGGMFAGYEWVMTNKYDKNNAEHRSIKHNIEYGDSLPDLANPEDVVQALKDAGFEVIEYFDVAEVAARNGNQVGWYETLQGGWSLSQVKHSPLGRFTTQRTVDVMEFLHIAPKGTSDTHRMLCAAADSLAAGGAQGIFTPMFFFLARKPANK